MVNLFPALIIRYHVPTICDMGMVGVEVRVLGLGLNICWLLEKPNITISTLLAAHDNSRLSWLRIVYPMRIRIDFCFFKRCVSLTVNV